MLFLYYPGLASAVSLVPWYVFVYKIGLLIIEELYLVFSSVRFSKYFPMIALIEILFLSPHLPNPLLLLKLIPSIFNIIISQKIYKKKFKIKYISV